ncbi:hypothetical protein HC766_06305 [Candidatus Gracilibacteria bacterium]|nr:hypothetical protein [Candidatus Gracilibacteria bacterium]
MHGMKFALEKKEKKELTVDSGQLTVDSGESIGVGAKRSGGDAPALALSLEFGIKRCQYSQLTHSQLKTI